MTQTNFTAASVRSMGVKELIDTFGAIKAEASTIKDQETMVRDEILRRRKDKATIDNTVEINGDTFYVTISFSIPKRLDVEALTKKIGEKVINRYRRTGDGQYVVKAHARVPKDDRNSKGTKRATRVRLPRG